MQLIRRKKREDKAAAATLDLYYASDVHGSDQCWRKFLGAGRFYGVQALIMGGDLTGKAIVPITIGRRVVHGRVPGRAAARAGQADSRSWRARSATTACTPGWPSAEEVSAAHGDAEVARAAVRAGDACDELRRWIDLADERMADYGIEVFVMPGNDDPWSCDAVIETAAHVSACDERIVEVGDHEMISCAYANPTPWNSPRELDEDELYAQHQAHSPSSWSRRRRRSSTCTSRRTTPASTRQTRSTPT